MQARAILAWKKSKFVTLMRIHPAQGWYWEIRKNSDTPGETDDDGDAPDLSGLVAGTGGYMCSGYVHWADTQ